MKNLVNALSKLTETGQATGYDISVYDLGANQPLEYLAAALLPSHMLLCRTASQITWPCRFLRDIIRGMCIATGVLLRFTGISILSPAIRDRPGQPTLAEELSYSRSSFQFDSFITTPEGHVATAT